jgi:hypothetical protein
MKRSVLAILMVAGTVVAPHVEAQTASDAAASSPATAASSPANPVDPAAIQALKTMGAHLQSLKRFSVSVDLIGERVLDDGQKLQHSATAQLDVDRPHRVRAVMRTARSEHEIFYDGKTVSFYVPQQKYYSTVAFDDSLAALVARLHERYGVEFPLSDLFVWGRPTHRPTSSNPRCSRARTISARI